MSPEPEGRIITFYSYKGGTGRSMALANVAWILASNGKRVLVMDWDLEAPGLQRYFYPFLFDKELTHSDGVINFVVGYKLKVMTPPPEGVELTSDWYLSEANIVRLASALKWDFPAGGQLDFVPAGRQNEEYSALVNSFAWHEFYDLLGGAKFLDAAKQHMRQNYDYILIDSRTGVSDTSGICTIQMPDDLVVCYTLNNQSIAGASAVALEAKRRRGGSLRVFPVPMRVDTFEKKKLELRMQFAARRFGPFPDHLGEVERESYRALAQVPYIPYYAYEELLATFGDTIPAESLSLLKAIERITAYLVGQELKATQIQVVTRNRILAEFEGSDEDRIDLEQALERFSSDELEGAKRVLTRLVRVAPPQNKGEDTSVPFKLDAFDDAPRKVVAALADVGIVTVRQGEVRLAEDWRSWQRLPEWIDDDRQFLLWRQDLYKVASNYSDSHDRRTLLRSGELTEAENWARRRKKDLVAVEIKYIEASSRWIKTRLIMLTGAGLVAATLVLALVFSYIATPRWQRASLIPEAGAGTGTVTMTALASGQVVISSNSLGAVWDAKTGSHVLLYGKSSTPLSGEYLLVIKQDGSQIVTSAECREKSCPQPNLTPKPFGDVSFDSSGRFLISTSSASPALNNTVATAAANMVTLQIWNAVGKQIVELQNSGFIIPQPAGIYYPRSDFVNSSGDMLVCILQRLMSPGTFSLPNQVAVLGLKNKLFRVLPVQGVVNFAVDEKRDQIAVLSQEKDGGFDVSMWRLSTGERISGPRLPDELRKQYWASISFFLDGSFLLLQQGSAISPFSSAAVLSTSELRPPASCTNTGQIFSASGQDYSGNVYIACTTTSKDLSLWGGNLSMPRLLRDFDVSTIDQIFVNADESRLVVIRKTGQSELWNFMSGQKMADLNAKSVDPDGNEATESAAFASFTLDGSAVSIRLSGGAITLYDINSTRGQQIARLAGAGGTKQQVYYDAGCGQANVWTDNGRVLQYTERKFLFRWPLFAQECGK